MVNLGKFCDGDGDGDNAYGRATWISKDFHDAAVPKQNCVRHHLVYMYQRTPSRQTPFIVFCAANHPFGVAMFG